MSKTDNDDMKMLTALVLLVLVASVFAEDTSKRAFPEFRAKKQLTETKSTKAYKKAKEACVSSSNGDLKGKKLTECIVNYQKETK